METDILKFVCSNGGAVDTAELVSNLYPGQYAAVAEVIRNQAKFVVCGESKVVARAKLWLCKAKDCPGTCRGLHLCKSFLFNGSCQFIRLRGFCSFSHELGSAHNLRILRTQELATLSRAELCTLLLQSDHVLLPPICFDYNNSAGPLGRCSAGEECKRLHICERNLSQQCSCLRSHDFSEQQPSRLLQERGVPTASFASLKSIYANRVALRLADKIAGRLRGNPGGADGGSAAGSDSDASEAGGVRRQEYIRGRGRGGNRGNRGNRGHRGSRAGHANQGARFPLSRATSVTEIFAGADLPDLDGLAIGGERQQERRASDVDGCDVRSDSGQGRNRRHGKNRNAVGGRGGGGAGEGEGDDRQTRPRPARDKTEICMYFIKGFCKHEEKCFKAHDKMPYRWEVNEGGKWTALPDADNEAIEKDYCDPRNSYSSSVVPQVHFDTMTRGADRVRRLSTVNSLKEPTFVHTTEWLWYWQDDVGEWKLYASDSGRHGPADMSSSALEQRFLDNAKDVVEFSAGSQSYSLSFEDMIQKNKHYGTPRVVSRRPRFVSAEEVKSRKGRKPQLQSVPDHWDKTQIPATGFARVPLQPTSAEFKEIKALFSQTMPGFDCEIERIQNKAFWEAFQLHKNQLKVENGGRDILEKRLFHGTDSKHVDAICRENIDWRICGTNGTVYGKGSYFARDARYSDQYTGITGQKTMFVCRVLVGDFTQGNSSYVRPPLKGDGKLQRYHSCVNDVTNPSIFVVFDMPKIYPEYLLRYKVSGAASLPTPAATPAVAPKVVTAPKPAAVPKPATTQATPLYRLHMQSSPSSSTHVPTPSRVPSSYHRVPYSYQSSSSSSLYSSSSSSTISQPSRTSPPVSSSPTGRKSNDSCVIA